MRNLAQYPITTEECESALSHQMESIQKSGAVGGTNQACLSYVLEFIKSNRGKFDKFLETKKIAA